jgi:hypothetical protein
MWIIAGSFVEEILAIGHVVRARRCCGREWWLNTFRMAKFKGAIYFVGRDVVEALAFVAFG